MIITIILILLRKNGMKKYRIDFSSDAYSWNNILSVFNKHKDWEMVEYGKSSRWFGCNAPNTYFIFYGSQIDEFKKCLQSCISQEL